MSDLNQGQSPQPGPPEKPTNRTATLVRQGVLIAILLIAGGALAYDYLVARPAAEKAFAKVDELYKSESTRDDVVKELGEPSETTDVSEKRTVAQYNFRSGLIFRTYKVYVVYSDDGHIETVTKDKAPPALSESS